MMPPTCTPLRKRCDYCGEEHVYRCAQLLLSRDPTNPDEACPGGTRVCFSCMDAFAEFMKAAYDARALRQEFAE